PLVKLWGINTDHAKVPSQSEIDEALPLVDYKSVEIMEDGNQKKVFLKQKGMSLDLGGIAKGYAADEIAKILSEEKIDCAIIDLGGNIYLWGKKKNGAPWNVGIKNPFDEKGSPALLLSCGENLSVVTSGIYERNFVQDGKLYHHILNPKTGFPGDDKYKSVTIVSSSSMEADALSTSAFLLGPEKYFSLFDTPAIFISEDRTVLCSSELISDVEANYGFTLRKVP
ncbi:MAG: FAD:protein FMN transferase, partial [Treponema sp.]|nr:FAD:protein FMN transferase [Treponema sp.]